MISWRKGYSWSACNHVVGWPFAGGVFSSCFSFRASSRRSTFRRRIGLNVKFLLHVQQPVIDLRKFHVLADPIQHLEQVAKHTVPVNLWRYTSGPAAWFRGCLFRDLVCGGNGVDKFADYITRICETPTEATYTPLTRDLTAPT